MDFKKLFSLKFCLLSIICYVLGFIICCCIKYYKPLVSIIPSSPEDAKIATSFLIDTKGCRIPYMDPYDASIRHCIFEETPIVCDKDGRGMLVKSLNNILYVDKTLLSKFGLTEETVDCCYQKFWSIYPNDRNLSRIRRYSENCTRFTEETMKDEFIHVKCSLPNNVTYEDEFIFVKERGENPPKDDGKLSVLLIGIDSTSRLNFHRQMPKTLKFLEKLNAVEMFGYNKVGSNTYPNLVPALTGMPTKKLEKLCVDNKITGYEKCPFMWKIYKKHGYLTGLGEDLGWKSFLKVTSQPTDFYYNVHDVPVNLEMFHEPSSNYFHCFGKRTLLEVLVDAIKQFVIKWKNFPKFGFFWTSSFSHDYLNFLRFADDHYYSLLKYMYDNGMLNSTIVILMSDHGLRIGCVRKTYQGYLEDNLPNLFLMYPTWFPDKYPKAVENLKTNARRLTSHFDLHKTLVDLIDLNNITNSALDHRLNEKQTTTGTSLFLPINGSRTCKDAGISFVFCSCYQSIPIDTNIKQVKKSAEKMVIHLNELLKNSKQCSTLYMIRIINARLEKTAENLERPTADFVQIYIVTFEAGPSMGHFEGNVKYTAAKNRYEVMPPLNRINAYGNQSFCIENPLLKPYCYCIT